MAAITFHAGDPRAIGLCDRCLHAIMQVELSALLPTGVMTSAIEFCPCDTARGIVRPSRLRNPRA